MVARRAKMINTAEIRTDSKCMDNGGVICPCINWLRRAIGSI
jgi:hypothetical protein